MSKEKKIKDTLWRIRLQPECEDICWELFKKFEIIAYPFEGYSEPDRESSLKEIMKGWAEEQPENKGSTKRILNALSQMEIDDRIWVRFGDAYLLYKVVEEPDFFDDPELIEADLYYGVGVEPVEIYPAPVKKLESTFNSGAPIQRVHIDDLKEASFFPVVDEELKDREIMAKEASDLQPYHKLDPEAKSELLYRESADKGKEEKKEAKDSFGDIVIEVLPKREREEQKREYYLPMLYEMPGLPESSEHFNPIRIYGDLVELWGECTIYTIRAGIAWTKYWVDLMDPQKWSKKDE